MPTPGHGGPEWGYHTRKEEGKRKKNIKKEFLALELKVERGRGAPVLVAECLVMPFERFLQKKMMRQRLRNPPTQSTD
jgi:hypothetical protein